MIRVSDFTTAAAWSRPAGPAPQRADLNNPSTWFDASDVAGAAVRISGDPSPAARGLSAEQHADRVLSFLCGDRDAAG